MDILRTGSSRAPEGYRFAQDDTFFLSFWGKYATAAGAEKGSVFAEERGSGRKPARATRRGYLDEWAERSDEESRM